MSWPSDAAWDRMARPLIVADEDDTPLLSTAKGTIRGAREDDLEGSALGYDALLVMRHDDLADLPGGKLRNFQHVSDPGTGSLYRIERTWFAFGPGGVALNKATLSGLQ